MKSIALSIVTVSAAGLAVYCEQRFMERSAITLTLASIWTLIALLRRSEA